VQDINKNAAGPQILAGVKLLLKMGWRRGRQIGPNHIAAGSGNDTLQSTYTPILYSTFILASKNISL
jgi:hypothetical protein